MPASETTQDIKTNSIKPVNRSDNETTGKFQVIKKIKKRDKVRVHDSVPLSKLNTMYDSKVQ